MHKTRFEWHAQAALFVGATELPRPVATRALGFRHIPAQNTRHSLSELTQAIDAGDPFCLAHALPCSVSASKGAILTLTGGASGVPKVIRRSQASWIASFAVNQTLFGWQPGHSVATLGAPVHSLTLYAVVEALHLGSQVHVLAGISPTTQRAQIVHHKVETLYTTPTQLRLLCSGKPKTVLHSLRHILCGGGTLDEATQQGAKQLCPNAAIHQFYGAAETSFVTLSDAMTPQGSVGRAYRDVEIEIRQGEVWVRSPYLFDGYASGGPHGHQTCDGFVSVGELGTLDPQGYLWLTGRKSRAVQIADQTVSPEAIELAIAAELRLPHCAVLPKYDAIRGTRLVVVVQASDRPQTAQAILDLCRAKFAPLIAPRNVVFVHDWPVLPSGKTDLMRLAPLLEHRS